MYTDRDLVIPAIKTMRELCDNEGFVSTTALREELINSVLDLDEYDIQDLPSGGCMRIEQIIRNLKCNKVLLDLGLADEVDRGFALVDAGRTLSDSEMEDAIVEYEKQPGAFGAKCLKNTNRLSNDEAMTKVLKTFKKAKVTFIIAGNFAIKSGMQDIGTFDNDADRIKSITNMVNDIIAEKPHFVKVIVKK